MSVGYLYHMRKGTEMCRKMFKVFMAKVVTKIKNLLPPLEVKHGTSFHRSRKTNKTFELAT